MVRLLAFVQKRPGISPGQRFRLEQWMPHLRETHGIEIELAVFESERLTEVLYEPGRIATKGALMVRDFARRADAVRLAREFDGAIVYREAATLGPAVWERVLARLDVPFLLDFDDAIWMSASDAPKTANGIFSRLRFPGKTRTIARLAKVVTVGNQFLADWASAFNSNVHIVPTSIDLDRYPVQPPVPSDEPFVIGWMGSHSTLANLELIRDAVEQLGAKRKTRFVIVCDTDLSPPFRNVENVFVRWKGDREAADIGAMHAGVMPLLDFAFARGKCGCKALQYMAAGRPSIVSPVGVNTDIVKHEVNGLLADSTSEWLEAFERLADSGDLRSRLAVAGRRTVESGYSASACAARFAAAVYAMLPSANAPRASASASSRLPREHTAS